MNPKLLFWVPALLRMALILAGAGLVGYFQGLVAGLATALCAAIALVFMQLSGRRLKLGKDF